MKVAAFSGIRGGTGTTSVVAALGFALQALGKRVLLIDLCPRNLLRLHANLPFETTAGWARADLDGSDWRDESFHIHGQLFLLPYGRVGAEGVAEIEGRLLRDTEYWTTRLDYLRGRIDWVLLDVPTGLPGHGRLPALREPPMCFQVTEADAAAHALLAQEPRDDTHLLVNRFDPASQLQRDLMLLWNECLRGRLVPQVIHRDESMAEALANKSPLGYFAADALAAQDVAGLATWCLAKQGQTG